MFEKENIDILLKFLDKKAKEAEKEIEEKGVLSDDKAIPLLLKTQFNHIAHLDSEISSLSTIMDNRFKQVEKHFEQVEKKIDRVFTVLAIGISFIALLIALSHFFGK
jgi:Fe2+ transport system protein B